ncbi:MAG: hypothetical protein GY866_37890 [Proteobacteria bacterium]|nr:hypothetical protein [Pseudomonadota bacterium]
MEKAFPKVVPFDDEEEELIESTENDENWKSVADVENRKREIEKAAGETNRK